MEELINKRLDIEQDITKKRKVLAEINEQIAFLEYGVKLGSIVRRRGNIYRVCEFSSFWKDTQPSVYGRKKISDGSFCGRFNLGHDWELIEE